MFLLNKNIVILCLFLLLLNGVFADDGDEKHLGKITISSSISERIINFDINKLENYRYYLKFEHYGTIGEDIQVNVYINENLVYTIDDSNNVPPWSPEEVEIDITEHLENGNNILRVEGINLSRYRRRYYTLNNIYIICKPSTTVKVPVSITQAIISIIATMLISVKYLSKYRI